MLEESELNWCGETASLKKTFFTRVFLGTLILELSSIS
jgi:hypothetical protein